MIDLSLIVLGFQNNIKNEQNNVEMIYSNGINLIDTIKDSKGRYIAFIKEEDNIREDYLKTVLNKCSDAFDCCFINYKIEYNYINEPKIIKNKDELKEFKPYYGEYIWAFIYNKESLIKILEIKDKDIFNKKVDEEFLNNTAIEDVIYFHKPTSTKLIKDFQLSDIKRNDYSKNIIYIGNGCNGVFNGYISWMKNIGRCFENKYEITFLYDNCIDETLKDFSKYFRCEQRKDDINYVCDRLLTTYSNYFYPKNITSLEENYLFIHGNMSDYPNTRVFHDDIYTKYIAVSKTAAEKAKGYFPTNNIDYILNPFKLDDSLTKPHLTLSSAFRYSDVKRPDRIEKMATILDELQIPYTWNLFTDKYENTNRNGLIYRTRVANPIPYIKDSDYFVLLSDSESYGYCVVEALSVNTKVVLTPLEVYNELGINDENATIIPFDYFEDSNKNKLKEIIIKMYEEKDKIVKYNIDESLWEKYNSIFKK